MAKISDLSAHPMKKVRVSGRDIALVHVGEQYYAFDNTCTHKGGPLAKGELSGETVTCPWHGGMFDVRTGDLLHPPPVERLRTYPVRITGEDIEIEFTD
ncbi:non-heme iron oxygenase ferredoxin subunit [Candidatus Poribacteria bacterium]|nr:non-heme iron oxygenase ferredoxin subunit [Candidatus Poribacteria bacterium]